MNCTDARPLIPSYLDGELTQAQAGPLRKHLLDCQPCRASAQDVKTLKRWFVPDERVQIPRDFAARVARRAFAGDRGTTDNAWTGAASSTAVMPGQSDDRNLRYVLMITSIAAVILIFLSIAIGSQNLPSSHKMDADDRKYVTMEKAIQELDRLNQADAKLAPEAPVLVQKSSPVTSSPPTSSPSVSATNGVGGVNAKPAANRLEDAKK